MATHRQMGEFNLQQRNWMSYSKRIEDYFTTNEKKSTKKRKIILLSVIGAETYQLIQA